LTLAGTACSVVGSLEDFGDYGGKLREHVERSLDQVTADQQETKPPPVICATRVKDDSVIVHT